MCRVRRLKSVGKRLSVAESARRVERRKTGGRRVWTESVPLLCVRQLLAHTRPAQAARDGSARDGSASDAYVAVARHDDDDQGPFQRCDCDPETKLNFGARSKWDADFWSFEYVETWKSFSNVATFSPLFFFTLSLVEDTPV